MSIKIQRQRIRVASELLNKAVQIIDIVVKAVDVDDSCRIVAALCRKKDMIAAVEKIPGHFQVFSGKFREAVENDHRTPRIFGKIALPAELRSVKGGKAARQPVGQKLLADAAQRFQICLLLQKDCLMTRTKGFHGILPGNRSMCQLYHVSHPVFNG